MSTTVSRNSKQKARLKERIFGWRLTMPCCFCKTKLTHDLATLEHIQPLSLGGGWHRSNLTCSCNACNQERGVQDFMSFLHHKRGAKTVPQKDRSP